MKKLFSSGSHMNPSFVGFCLFFCTAVVLAAWYGAWEVDWNPRDRARDEDSRNFIRGVVNSNVDAWMLGDLVTLCPRGSNDCALFAYVPYNTAGFAFARYTDRVEPEETNLIRRIFRLLFGQEHDQIVFIQGEGLATKDRLGDYIWRMGIDSGTYSGVVYGGQLTVLDRDN